MVLKVIGFGETTNNVNVDRKKNEDERLNPRNFNKKRKNQRRKARCG